MPGLEQSKERVSAKVFEAYLNSQNNSMKANIAKLSGVKAKRFILPALAFFTLVLVVVPTFILFGGHFGDKKNGDTLIASEISYVEGNVEYKTKDGEWIKATKEIILQEGASIKTASDAKTIINLDDGSSVRLNKDSQVTLISMNADDIVISNDQGEVYTRVAKLEREFAVTANNVTYQSLGTAYKTINTEEKNGVEVYHSQVNILGVNTDNEILVEQGNRYYIVNTQATDLEGKVTELPLDEIATDEFVLWNKDQDEQVNEFKEQMGVLFDLVPPALEIASPADGSTTESDKVTVNGRTEADATITIDADIVENTEGNFSKEVTLNEGVNNIQIIATDPAGNKTVKNLTVTYTKKVETPVVTSYIKLTGAKVDNGISFSWSVSGLDVSNGFKLVKSTSTNPVYPGNDYQYLTNGSTRQYTWQITDGKTYHFRICQYNGNGVCLKYSNDITVTAPGGAATQSAVSSISLSDLGDGKVKWSVNGYSDMGFKVVWSKTSTPTYPTRSTDQYQYFSDPNKTTSDVIDAFDGAGTYYVRVCEYLGGACGVYSNQITINLL